MMFQYVSVAIEAIIFILALIIAIKKKKPYCFAFALTFMIYVFYDLAKISVFAVSDELLYPMFFMASVSALLAIWMLFNELFEIDD